MCIIWSYGPFYVFQLFQVQTDGHQKMKQNITIIDLDTLNWMKTDLNGNQK